MSLSMLGRSGVFLVVVPPLPSEMGGCVLWDSPLSLINDKCAHVAFCSTTTGSQFTHLSYGHNAQTREQDTGGEGCGGGMTVVKFKGQRVNDHWCSPVVDA